MAFTRAFLTSHGVPEEQVDAIMAERNRTLADYVPKADVQTQIEEALRNHHAEPAPVKDSDEYKAIAAELGMVRALNGEEYAEVKPKFRETVYKMLDHADGAKPLAEQLAGVKERYEEYFTTASQTQQSPPSFGGKVDGQMPKGTGGDSFAKYWGYKT